MSTRNTILYLCSKDWTKEIHVFHDVVDDQIHVEVEMNGVHLHLVVMPHEEIEGGENEHTSTPGPDRPGPTS